MNIVLLVCYVRVLKIIMQIPLSDGYLFENWLNFPIESLLKKPSKYYFWRL